MARFWKLYNKRIFMTRLLLFISILLFGRPGFSQPPVPDQVQKLFEHLQLENEGIEPYCIKFLTDFGPDNETLVYFATSDTSQILCLIDSETGEITAALEEKYLYFNETCCYDLCAAKLDTSLSIHDTYESFGLVSHFSPASSFFPTSHDITLYIRKDSLIIPVAHELPVSLYHQYHNIQKECEGTAYRHHITIYAEGGAHDGFNNLCLEEKIMITTAYIEEGECVEEIQFEYFDQRIKYLGPYYEKHIDLFETYKFR